MCGGRQHPKTAAKKVVVAVGMKDGSWGVTQIMGELLAFTQTQDVYGLGRWGEYSHYNFDVTVERAMSLA